MRRIGTPILVAIAIVGTLFTISCVKNLPDSIEQRQEATTTAIEAVEAEISCILLAPRNLPQAWEDLRNTWGTLDYSGGTIYAVDSGAIIGYAAAEDDDIWNLPQCTRPA
jgi:hypothetical protein